MITSLLVANRGEIARRIIRTCRDAGIRTVAVYSDPDAGSAHALEADLGVPLPGASPAETYLRGDLIIEAAKAAGADAIHPGYGFLSENADFAEAVMEAGLIWVGPTPAAMRAMALKVQARQLVAGIGVPILQSTTQRYPLIIKASAGGGGRGMRIVRPRRSCPPRSSSEGGSGERLRRRGRLHRALPGVGPSHRGADPRRHPRHHLGAGRARMFPATAASEGDRGDAVAPGRADTRAACAAFRGGDSRRQSGLLHRRGDGRISRARARTSTSWR